MGVEDGTYSVEDIIMSLYGMELLLKRIKEKQIRKCLYDWKYKSLINKELNIQRKKYNKYMLDGFYALTRQTQSVCMLFNLFRMGDNKLKSYAFNRLLINARNNEISENNLVSIDERIIQEFQHGIMTIINGFSSLGFIVNKKKFRALYCSFHKVLNHKGRASVERNNENTNKLNAIDENLIFENTKCKSDKPEFDNLIDNNNVLTENKCNKKLALNHGLFLNKNDIYTQNDDNIKLYNKNQSTSLNNGYYIHVPISRQKAKFDYYNELAQTGSDYNNNNCFNSNNNFIKEFSPLNPVLYPPLRPQVNSYDYSIQKQHVYNSAGLINTNFVNPVLNRRLSPNNSNANSFRTSNSGISTAAPSPLNTTKYSVDNLYYSVDYNKNNKQNNYGHKRNSIYEKITPKSTENPSKNFINPCINFTQDSSIILNSITDKFKSVILN
ncbi:hypothetical protein FG379_002761 [Cryptosporidium bovis]|uniref:uncharacterized protein n=1 Tax=Cryptosporidium bovis TaxID=310047 RepID=UPI00351A84D5|nr:hypothetical protein FG379_002761 [Cryptosporidium bovis]